MPLPAPSVFIAGVLWAGMSSVLAAPSYQLQSIHPDGAIRSAATDIADDGTVLMSADFGSGSEVLLVRNQEITRLPTIPGALGMSAGKMSASGTVVGTYSVGSLDPSGAPSLTFHGFIYEDGVSNSFDIPGGEETSLLGISANGRFLVGFSSSASTSGYSAFRYDRWTSEVVQIPRSPQAGRAGLPMASAVTDDGVVLVSQAGIWVDDYSRYDAVSYLYNPFRGIQQSWFSAGTTDAIRLQDFNSRGEYVGTGYEFNGEDVLYTGRIGEPGAMETFGTESALTQMLGINEHGVGVGWSSTLDGEFGYAIMAVPVPEPSTWLLMTLGLAAIGWTAGRRPTQRGGKPRQPLARFTPPADRSSAA